MPRRWTNFYIVVRMEMRIKASRCGGMRHAHELMILDKDLQFGSIERNDQTLVKPLPGEQMNRDKPISVVVWSQRNMSDHEKWKGNPLTLQLCPSLLAHNHGCSYQTTPTRKQNRYVSRSSQKTIPFPTRTERTKSEVCPMTSQGPQLHLPYVCILLFNKDK
jgi:hypothetical protein